MDADAQEIDDKIRIEQECASSKYNSPPMKATVHKRQQGHYQLRETPRCNKRYTNS